MTVRRIVDVAPRLVIGGLAVAVVGFVAANAAAIWSIEHMDADRAGRESEFQLAQLAWDLGTRAVGIGLIVTAVAAAILIASAVANRARS